MYISVADWSSIVSSRLDAKIVKDHVFPNVEGQTDRLTAQVRFMRRQLILLNMPRCMRPIHACHIHIYSHVVRH